MNKENDKNEATRQKKGHWQIIKELSPLGKIIGTIIATSFIFAVTVVYFYFAKFGIFNLHPERLSANQDDWGNFGSLLSGLFTSVAAFSVLGTLFYLQTQSENQVQQIESDRRSQAANLALQKEQFAEQIARQDEQFRMQLDQQREHFEKAQAEQNKINEKQIESINFRQYIDHKDLFKLELTKIENKFENYIIFDDKDYIYDSVFPDNTPPHFSYYNFSQINGSIEIPRITSQLIETVIKIKKSLKNDSVNEFLENVYSLNYTFKLSFNGNDLEGELEDESRNYCGVNIYKPQKTIEILSIIFNTITGFSNSIKLFSYLEKIKKENEASISFEELARITEQIGNTGLREVSHFDTEKFKVSLIKHFNFQDSEFITKSSMGIIYLEELYLFLKRITEEDNVYPGRDIFSSPKYKLKLIFDDPSKVKNAPFSQVVDEIIDDCEREEEFIRAAEKTTPNLDEQIPFQQLNRILDNLREYKAP